MKFKDKTRGGYPVRILATDLPGGYPVCAIIQDGTSGGLLSRYKPDGRYGFLDTPYDLIPDIPQQMKVVRWHIMPFPEEWGFSSFEEASLKYSCGKIVRVTLEWTED